MGRDRVVLTVDIGGSHVKALASDREIGEVRRVESGPGLTPGCLKELVKGLVSGWSFDVVSVGFPARVRGDRVIGEPVHLGAGWVGLDFAGLFGKPTRVLNDAAMQALGSDEGKRMLFLGLGTGLGTAFVMDGRVVDLEFGHVTGGSGRTYEADLGQAGLDRMGVDAWRERVGAVARELGAGFLAEEVVLGGGNARLVGEASPPVRLGDNLLAFEGGARLWR